MLGCAYLHTFSHLLLFCLFVYLFVCFRLLLFGVVVAAAALFLLFIRECFFGIWLLFLLLCGSSFAVNAL